MIMKIQKSQKFELSNRTGENSPCDGGVSPFKELYFKHRKSHTSLMETKMKNLNVVFNGIAVAMGIAIIVLNIVNSLSLASTTTLLGIGIAALGIANLRKAS